MLFVTDKKYMDIDARARVRRWLLWFKRTKFWDKGDVELARYLQIAPTTLSPILAGKRQAGFDVFIKLHRRGGIPADLLLDSDPPEPR